MCNNELPNFILNTPRKFLFINLFGKKEIDVNFIPNDFEVLNRKLSF